MPATTVPTPHVSRETIAAIATAPGRAGIGVVRLSGKGVGRLAEALLGKLPPARLATLAVFADETGQPIDQGVALWFPAPHSYTGEDVLELQGHGGPAVLQRLLRRCLELGARLAEPGEFTLRAYLNGKIDLAQAESVADLIDASSAEAAQSAARSLVGDFSKEVRGLVDRLVELRMQVEAGIDFPEEEIDPAGREALAQRLAAATQQLDRLTAAAAQGALLRDGLTVVLIGRPNVGKSSLLNRLAGEDLAIVTPIAGTTRDQVRASITLEGVPVHLIDTAGLRETDDEVEKIGITRTWAAVRAAGAAVLIAEAGEMIGPAEATILAELPTNLPVAWVYNKIDLHGRDATMRAKSLQDANHTSIYLSALTGAGVDGLRQWMLHVAGWKPGSDGVFMARARHLDALRQARQHLQQATAVAGQFELFAEELRLAQRALSTITGEFSADDLLGEIFSRFCIGK